MKAMHYILWYVTVTAKETGAQIGDAVGVNTHTLDHRNEPAAAMHTFGNHITVLTVHMYAYIAVSTRPLTPAVAGTD